MAEKHIFIWVVLIVLFVVCAVWHVRENKALAAEWKKELDANTAHWLERFAWSRSIQLLAALSCSIIIIITYDWQLGNAHSNVNSLLAVKAQSDKQHAAELRRQLALAKERISSARQKPVNLEAVMQAPPAPAATPAIPTVTASAAQIPTPAKAATIEDVYNPERSAGDNQSGMDDVKKRYEDILVIYMYLKNCGRVQSADYNTITSALAQEMASLNAPGRLQYDILTSAQGSYKEIYSKSSCNDANIETLNQQYTNYIQTLSANFPPQ